LLAGPAGSEVLTNGNLVDFFTQVRSWYGHQASVIGNAAPPDRADFDLGLSHPTHFEAFNIFVPYGDAQIDIPAGASVTPTDFSRFFSASGSENSLATLTGPLGFGEEQFLPVDQALPFSVQFENDPNATVAVGEIRVVVPLDAGLDPQSFRLGDMKIGDILVDIPEGRATFQAERDFTRARVSFSASVPASTWPRTPRPGCCRRSTRILVTLSAIRRRDFCRRTTRRVAAAASSATRCRLVAM
jgi:hypothetical protein